MPDAADTHADADDYSDTNACDNDDDAVTHFPWTFIFDSGKSWWCEVPVDCQHHPLRPQRQHH